MIDLSGVEGVLGRIGRSALERVGEEKKRVLLSALQEESKAFTPKDFAQNLRLPGIRVIAEVKMASPSKGKIAPSLNPLRVAKEYLAAGAAALSVLTEPYYFKGSIDYLRQIRLAHPHAFLLMKDFFVDSYQLWQARAAGADAILVIVALLGEEASGKMIEEAKSMGLTPLVEVHDETEFAIAKRLGASLIGVNNRNLKDLTISLETTERLLAKKDDLKTYVGESGIESGQDLLRLKKAGCHGFLIGSSLMASGHPGAALRRLLEETGGVTG